MKHLLLLLGLVTSFCLNAQTNSEEGELFNSIKLDGGFPTNLLATRSVVFYNEAVVEVDLETIQKAFQQTGIDAVSYFETARSLAGLDCKRAAVKYLTKRDIRYLIFLRKVNQQFEFYFIPFNGKTDFFDRNQSVWFIKEQLLNNALLIIYQTSINAEKKQNFLINDLPEHITEKEASPFVGRRNETLGTDIGYFMVAFPKFGNEQVDRELEQLLKESYNGKYGLVDANADEGDLRKAGFLFVLRNVHTKGSLAKDVLGYESTKSASAIASATFTNGELQLKTIPAQQEVFKFYFKKLETGEVFLGKWDADVLWQDALSNHINAYKAEKKLK